MLFRPIQIQCVCVLCEYRYNCTFVYTLVILFSILIQPFVQCVNCVYVNTQLQHTCTKGKAHGTPSIDDDADADDNDTDDDDDVDGADDDDNDFLFLCEILVVITMPESASTCKLITALRISIEIFAKHVYQILKSVKSFKHKRPLSECDMRCECGAKK